LTGAELEKYSPHGLLYGTAPGATMRRWAAIALKVRTAEIVVHSITVPVDGSAFAVTDEMYPTESPSQWAREPLRSAVDHLATWVNHAVPLEQYEGHEWRPGRYHLTGYPDAEKLTGMLEDATDFLDRATIRYLIRMGADVRRELKDALITAAERTASTDGGELVRAMRETFDEEFISDL